MHRDGTAVREFTRRGAALISKLPDTHDNHVRAVFYESAWFPDYAYTTFRIDSIQTISFLEFFK